MKPANNKFEGYTQVEPTYIKPLVPYILVLLLISFIIFALTSFNWNYLFIGALVSIFILLLVHTFRKRICPKCGEPMKQDYDGGLIPANHFCEKDKIFISAHLENADWV